MLSYSLNTEMAHQHNSCLYRVNCALSHKKPFILMLKCTDKYSILLDLMIKGSSRLLVCYM